MKQTVVSAWASMILATILVDGVARGGQVADGVVRFDFESGKLDGWRIVEGEFGKFVCDRAVFHHTGETYTKQGRFFLSTLEREDDKPSDGFTGIAESPVFVLGAPEISFLIGGGSGASTYMALCDSDGRELLKGHGDDSQQMRRIEWNASELVGTRVFVRIVDDSTGGWGHVTFDDFMAEGTIDAELTRENFARAVNRKAAREFHRRLEQLDTTALRAVIEDLAASFPDRYTDGDELLSRLEGHEQFLGEIQARLHKGEISAQAASNALDGLEKFRRDALIANPLVSDRPILFVTRRQYRPDHHNTATLFQTGEVNTDKFDGGGALKVVDFDDGGQVVTLLETSTGVIRDPEVHFDGETIIFSMRRDIAEDYHIHEVKADGSGLRQLTSAVSVADIDPLYLPGGGIVFSSTREPKYCMCNQHIMANLFRMDADGANIHQIGKSTLFEGHAALLPDGRVLYDRWEYVDRNFGDAQGLWAVNPDGTNHTVYWGNNTNSPGGVIDARAIPGSQQTICIFGSCHDRPWGAVAIVDRRLGIDGRAAVTRTWPAGAVELVGTGDWDTFKQVLPKYEDPWPLNEKYFLCARTTGAGEEMGIYLIDIFGNELLLHAEAPGCYDPMPIAPRTRPPIIPDRRDMAAEHGQFYVVDVYNGTHMAGVQRGVVKYLRVVESPEKQTWTDPSWGGQGVQRPAMNWHDFNNKRILGTVPVEEDGSAYFKVPSDRFVYFQLLGADGMMVQSMRSGTMVQPGETIGCVGCHDHRRTAPPPLTSEMPLAVRRAASEMEGWRGPPRLFSYATEVQPVFDKACVRCHDYGQEAGEKLNLTGDRTLTFNTSYNELWRKKLVKAIGAGPAEIQLPYSWGAHTSRLVKVIRDGHEDVELSPEEFDRIVTWIDLNAPYYSSYSCAYPDNLAGRSPLDARQIKRLGELTGRPLSGLATHHGNRGPQVSFDRPELSPCLAILREADEAKYAEALAIIRAGREVLEQRPRADMAGFEACPADRARHAKYIERQKTESRNRAAILEGRREYDSQAE